MDDKFVQAETYLRGAEQVCANPFSRSTIMEPWASDFVDVPSIHSEATTEINKLIQKVHEEGRSKARLLIGDVANGKSHVLARTKNQFSDRAFFCFVEPLTGDGDNIFRHILSNTVRDLLRSVPGAGFPQFHRVWRDFFLGAARDKVQNRHNFEAWMEGRKFDFICRIDSQLKAAGKTIDPAIVGLLYEYVKNFSSNARIRLIIENWLGAKTVSEEEQNLVDLPFNSCIDNEDKAKEMIKALGLVTSYSRPIFLCFDQVENYILNDRAFRAFMKAIEYVVEYTHNYALVTAALLTFDEKLRTSGLTPSTWDRFNYTGKPIVVHPLSPEQGEELIEARIAAEVGNLAICTERPLFPFASADLDIILTPPAAHARTYKQARYILEDAETIFDDIVGKSPAAREIMRYFDEDISLNKSRDESQVVRWPRRADVERYLTDTMEGTFARYRSDPYSVVSDEEYNRQILLDLLFGTITRGIKTKFLDIDTLTVYRRENSSACDFALTVKREGGSSRSVGVLFSNDNRVNTIQGLVKTVTKLLQSRALDEFVYVRDSRFSLTERGRSLLNAFERRFSKGSKRVILSSADADTIHHLRAMSRLIELAGSGGLLLKHQELKRDYRISQNDVCEYLLKNNCLLVNKIILTIVTGRDHCCVYDG